MNTIILNGNDVATDVRATTCKVNGKVIKFTYTHEYDAGAGEYTYFLTFKNAVVDDGGDIRKTLFNTKLSMPNVVKSVYTGHKAYLKVLHDKADAKHNEELALREANKKISTMTAFEFRKAVWEKHRLFIDYAPYSPGRFRIYDEINDVTINEKRHSITSKGGKYITSVDIHKKFNDDGIEELYQKYRESFVKESRKEYNKMLKALDKLD